MEGLHHRCRQIVQDVARCRDEILTARLQEELVGLQRRQQDLRRSVTNLRRCGLRDPLALAFLEELTRRPLVV
jgi:hypothetical protein